MRTSVGHIAGAGLLALDVIICDEHAPEALTFAGGTCGNVLSILSYFDWTSSAVGTVGDDKAADRIVSDLRSVGVSATHLSRNSQLRTPVFFQTFHADEKGSAKHRFSRFCPRCGQEMSTHNTTGTPICEFAHFEAPDAFFMDRLSDDILALAASSKAHGAIVCSEAPSESDAVFWPTAFE